MEKNDRRGVNAAVEEGEIIRQKILTIQQYG